MCEIIYIYPAASSLNGLVTVVVGSSRLYLLRKPVPKRAFLCKCKVLSSRWGTPISLRVLLPLLPPFSSQGGIVIICPTLVFRRKDSTALVALSSKSKAILGALGCFHPQSLPTSSRALESVASRPRSSQRDGYGSASRPGRTTSTFRTTACGFCRQLVVNHCVP